MSTDSYSDTEAMAIIPTKEPERQLYFIEKLHEQLIQEKDRTGRQKTYHVVTFGCQMNTEVEIEKAA